MIEGRMKSVSLHKLKTNTPSNNSNNVFGTLCPVELIKNSKHKQHIMVLEIVMWVELFFDNH